jgi:hypothetical protein
MYIPTTFFGSQGSCFEITTSNISGSGLITTGSFISGGVYWDYYKFEMTDKEDANLTAFTASLNILSGSTGQAKILIVGGGGTGAQTGNVEDGSDGQWAVVTTGGGGAGGVVYYNNFPISSGSYTIGIGKATSGPGGFYGGSNVAQFVSGLTAGLLGQPSWIKLPDNRTYTPFSNSYLVGYGGGGSSSQGSFFRLSPGPTRMFIRDFGGQSSTSSLLLGDLYNGSGGGGGNVVSSTVIGGTPGTSGGNTAGPNGGLNGVGQGSSGGTGLGGANIDGFCINGTGVGGGGAGAAGADRQLTAGGEAASGGGIGAVFNLTGTPTYYAGGGGGRATSNSGGATGRGLGDYGCGGNGSLYGNNMNGQAGVVIIAIPRCSTAFDCKTFAISGSGNTVSYLECSNFGFTTSSTNIPYYDTLRVCLTTLSGSNTPLLLSGSYLSSTLISSCDSPSTTLIPTTYPRPFDTCSCLSYTITPRVNPITINRIQYCGSSTSGSSLTIASGSATTLCLVSSSVSLLSITGSSYNFDFNGNCVTSSCAPLNSLSVNYLIVGGGGAGGGYYGGGGGGGGYLQGVAYLNLSQSYNIVVGNGGTGSAGSVGGNGQDSSVFTFTAIGGGGGGAVRPNQNGIAGGSGGGGGFDLSGTGGAGTSGQGNNGGNTAGGTGDSAGGGGASAVGANGSSNSNGGAGSLWLDGNRYGGGGGGYRTETSLQTGNGLGSNGGGNGAQATSLDVYLRANTSGSANTGGGGGGTAQSATGSMNGGSGIVKIRYVATASLATGGDISITGSFVYHTFTGSGTFTTL